MSDRLFPFGSSRVLGRARRLRTQAGAFVVACAVCLIPFAVSAANFTVTPTNLVFGNVPTGATGTIAVTITNTSGISQTPNFAGGAPNDPTNFGGSQNCAGVALAAGGSCKFTYTFTPATVGAHSSSTTIGINSENFSITMSGTGISPVSVTPTNLVFGNVPTGATGTIAVTITNTSGVSQKPNYAGGAPNDPTNFGGSQNCAGVTLAAGASCKFTYTFTPATLGAHSSSTTIGINSQNFSITMSGTGTSPFSVAPTNLVFGNVPVGATATIPVTITNTSGVSQKPNYAGGAPNDPTNFGGSQNCAGVTLAAGASCKFTYTFTPATLGAHSSSTTIDINSQSFSITMSGTGTSQFSVAPTNLVFGSVPLGATATLAVTITNLSGVTQTPNFAGGAPNDPTNFGGSQNCAGVPLPSGGSCKFTYTFTPKTLGAHSSSTTIGINSQNFPITMSGTGIGITVAPTTINFGSVLVGTTSVAKAATVTNVSAVPLGPLSVGGGAPAAPFGASQSCAGVTLAAGGTCEFDYTFTPAAVGIASGSSTFTINGESFTVTLAGTGRTAQIAISTVVEFYNASLDHYFITWVANEIADLDHGVHAGWQRTGNTFKTYTTPQTGTSPVCRFYIPPDLGDSHFFGRGTTECNDTANKFPQLILEDPEFMHMFLPTNGVCPPNTIEVHRAFSNRADANHRYMTDLAVLNQMTALNWLAEGDGPDLVVMCAPS